MKPTKNQIEILLHSLGLNERNKKSYRNQYVLSKDSEGYSDCLELCEMDYMKNHGSLGEISGGMEVFTVTEKGKSYLGIV